MPIKATLDGCESHFASPKKPWTDVSPEHGVNHGFKGCEMDFTTIHSMIFKSGVQPKVQERWPWMQTFAQEINPRNGGRTGLTLDELTNHSDSKGSDLCVLDNLGGSRPFPQLFGSF